MLEYFRGMIAAHFRRCLERFRGYDLLIHLDRRPLFGLYCLRPSQGFHLRAAQASICDFTLTVRPTKHPRGIFGLSLDVAASMMPRLALLLP